MKKTSLLLAFCLYILSVSYSQVIIFEEHFGTNAWSGHPSDYPDYTSSAIFSGDDPHSFSVSNSSGYNGASGGVAVSMGAWTTPANEEFVLQTNTEAYISCKLSFGIKHNSGGWGTCQLTNNFTLIEYSTDSLSWTAIDKAQLLDGSSWPCAEDNVWSCIKLAEVLPSSPSLYIRFKHTTPDTHPFVLDDILITGYEPDNTPPLSPENITSTDIKYGSFIMYWNAAVDEGGISYYKVFKNGKYLLSTKDTVVRIDYQNPGSTADFSVRAYDIAENESDESSALSVSFSEKPADFKYSWESKQVKVLPSGEMEWKPEKFDFVAGSSVRYIDFEQGDDTNDGLTRQSAWKHHPWDNKAVGVAAATGGIHTYIFKRGVIYRGQLQAKESGSPLEPIRLTSDPEWGSGEAGFYGSKRISGTWTRGNTASAPDIPDPEKVWYINISLPDTKMICEVNGEKLKELHVARIPNYKFTADDPLKSWFTWTSKSTTSGGLWLKDSKNLSQKGEDFLKGATVFSQEDAIVMCTVWKQEVSEWDADEARIKVPVTSFGGKGCHYYVENTPFLLDTTSEFYYNKSLGRLYLRLDGDKDPNTAVIEAAEFSELIRIDNKHDIEISGLSFGMTTAHTVRYGQNDAISAIRITGICSDINIRNNKFNNVVGGISVNSIGSAEVNTHSIDVCDNDFQNVSDLAIVFATNNAYIDDVNILRNNIYNNGYRHQGRSYSSIPAIYGQLNYGQIAGNIINYSWGNGIDMFWGKGSGSEASVPFIRGMIYQNSASNTLIATNDYGGIESWQGGPAFCYNNNSHNASGYKHYNGQSIGYAYYFDGSFKHIVFNNIASGVSHNRNSASFMQVLGYYNIYAHNSAYMTNIFFNAWKDALAVCGYNIFLSNLGQDINKMFNYEIQPENIPFEAYGNNIASGLPFNGGIENLNDNLSLADFQGTLKAYQAQLTQAGYNASADVLPNAELKDFRPVLASEAGEKGVKFFTAFPLSRVVGEWNFYMHPADLSLIMGDNFYMTEDYSDRETYKDIPKNHLTAVNVDSSSFVTGKLEDWTRGALEFDGSVYCTIDHTAASSVKSNNIDMTDNDFIIELFMKTELGHTGGAIVSKYADGDGYELGIDATGTAIITLFKSGSAVISRAGSVLVNDSLWHHVLVEVNRFSGMDIYIDGVLSNGVLTGTMPEPGTSLSNTADLLVGKDSDNNYFLGVLDFLRISKGSLFEAKTSVDEIFKWETDGPFLYDIKGNAPEGIRDAGAIESFSNCDFWVSDISLEFDYSASAMEFTAHSSDGVMVKSNGDFFSVMMSNDTIQVTVDENPTTEERTGSISVLGCGSSEVLTVSQAAGPCVFACDIDTVELSYQAQDVKIPFKSNTDVTAGFIAEGFICGAQILESDTMVLSIGENVSINERSDVLQVFACDDVHDVILIQSGGPCTFSILDSMELSKDQQEFVIYVGTNSFFTVGIIPDAYVSISSGPAADSVVMNIQENTSSETRSLLLPIFVCDMTHELKIIQEGLLSVNDGLYEGNMKIYPNPVKGGLINLRLPPPIVKCKYSITDLSGTEIQNGFLFNNSAVIEMKVRSGTYILTVMDSKNIYRDRIVII